MNKVIYAVLFERLHRYVFDKLYIQEYQINWRDKIVLFIYHTGHKMYPKWRYALKYHFGPCQKYDRYLVHFFRPYKKQLIPKP